MNFRVTAILLGLVLVFGLVLLGLTLFTGDNPAADGVLEELIKAGVTAEEIDSVVITREPGGTLKLVRDSQAGWKITEPVNARANPAAVNAVIDELLKAKPTSYPGLSSSPAQHGLAPPSLKVTLSGKGTSSTINIGNITPGDARGVAFVTTSARPDRPMAVRRSDVAALLREGATEDTAGAAARWVAEYRSPTVFPVAPPEDVSRLRLVSRGKEVEFSRVTGGWKFDKPDWGRVEAAGAGVPTSGTLTSVPALLSAITSLRAAIVPDPNKPAFIENPGDLAQYGLDPGSRIELVLTYQDGRTERAFLGKKIDPPPPAAGQLPAVSDEAYAQVEGDSSVMRVKTTQRDAVASLVGDPKPLLDHTPMPAGTDAERFSAIDVTVYDKPGQPAQVRLRRDSAPQAQPGFAPPNRWQLVGGPGDPQPVRFAANFPEQLLGMLGQPRLAIDVLPPGTPGADAFFAPNELRSVIKLWTETEKPDPKAPSLTSGKGDPLTFEFGKTRIEKVKETVQENGKDVVKEVEKATGVYVRRTLPGGIRTDFVLPLKAPAMGIEADLLASAMPKRLNLIDPRTAIPGFLPVEVSSYTVRVNDVNYDLTRTDGSGTGWKYTRSDQPGPPRDADKNTAEDLLFKLANLHSVMPPEPFVGEDMPAPELIARRLDGAPPGIKVVLRFKSPKPGEQPPPERTYFFGHTVERDGQQYVYARQEDRPIVALVARSVPDILTSGTADLRDKAVLKIDPSKVTQITFTGWYDANTGLPFRYTLKRKEGAGAVWERLDVPPGSKIPTLGGGQTALGPLRPWPAGVKSTQVNGFLQELHGLRAKAFLAGDSKPEYRFDWMQSPGGLEVVLNVEGQPSPIVMLIGASTDADSAFYTMLGTLPPNERCFTMPATAGMRELKKNPHWFEAAK